MADRAQVISDRPPMPRVAPVTSANVTVSVMAFLPKQDCTFDADRFSYFLSAVRYSSRRIPPCIQNHCAMLVFKHQGKNGCGSEIGRNLALDSGEEGYRGDDE
jgi:hypothetical protein